MNPKQLAQFLMIKFWAMLSGMGSLNQIRKECVLYKNFRLQQLLKYFNEYCECLRIMQDDDCFADKIRPLADIKSFPLGEEAGSQLEANA